MKDFTREFDVDIEPVGDGIYRAALSSDMPIRMPWGIEVLKHSKNSINMERAQEGLPLLLNHDRGVLLGKIKNINIEKGNPGSNVLRGDIAFDMDDPAAVLWEGKVKRNFAGKMSIAGTIEETKRKDGEDSAIFTHTRWTPVEGSLVTVPADNSVGVNRSIEETNMSIDDGDGGNVVNFESGVVEGKQQGVAEERKRISLLRTYFSTRKLKNDATQELESKCIAEGHSVERAAKLYADIVEGHIGESKPVQREQNVQETYGGKPVQAQIISDESDNFARNIEDSLMIRTQMIKDKKEYSEKAKHAQFIHTPLSEIARQFLVRQGRTHANLLPAHDVIGEALIMRNVGVGQTASNFTDILENIATKAAGVGYEEAEESWRVWCRTGSVPDFKQAKRVNLSAFSNLDLIPDGANYQVGEFSDVGEPIQANEYAKNFVISRQALINDDTDSFSRIPQAMGRAAARKVGDVVYEDILKGTGGVGPTLTQDSTALFDVSTHGNYVTSGAAPSIDTIDAGFTAMATQTDPSGNATLNLVPRYIVHPVALSTTVFTILNSTAAPEGGRAAPNLSTDDTRGPAATNRFSGSMVSVAEARLDNSSFKGATGWYLAASTTQSDTIEVAFLQGAESPVIRQEEQISRSGVTYLVRLDFGVAALDFRGLYYNDGD